MFCAGGVGDEKEGEGIKANSNLILRGSAYCYCGLCYCHSGLDPESIMQNTNSRLVGNC